MSAIALSFDFFSRPVPAPPLPAPTPPSPQRDDVRRLRESLAATVAAKVMNATELIRALDKARRDETLPTTLAPLDGLLGGGLPRGKMVEITGRRTTGRFAIAMSALAAATSMGEAAVLVDLGDHFDPRLAEENGVDLRRMLWIRPKTLKQAVMSVEMITATGFQLVVLDVGVHPIRGRRVPDAAWVRLGRTAEAHGAAMMISTPYPLTGTASEAVVAMKRSRAKWLGKGNAPRVLAGTTIDLRLEKHRHLKPGGHVSLSLSVGPFVRWSVETVADAKRHEPTDQRTNEPSVDPFVRWSVETVADAKRHEPTDQRTNGPSVDPFVRWSEEAVADAKRHEPTDQRTNEPSVGPFVRWSEEAVADAKRHGPTDQRTNGPTAVHG